MKGIIKSSVICVLLVLSIVMFASCKKKVNTEPEAAVETQEVAVDETTNEVENVAVEEDNLEEAIAGEDTEANNDLEAKNDAEMAQLKDDFENVTISFDYDSSEIMESAIPILEVKAEWLRNNADATITIEGHCDERGTTEYNLALGDRRAARVKSFLTNLGIDAKRITTISYGEERPVASGNNETVWAKNRRAKCVID